MADTEIIRADESFLDSEERFRIVSETAADAIITINDRSRILFANRAASKIFGYSAEELIGSDLTKLMPEYLRHLHEHGLSRYVETGRRHISWEGVELPGLHKSGREMTLEISFGESTKDGKRYFTGIARDISERKRAERRLAAQHAVAAVLADATTLADATERILRAVCESLNWEIGDFWAVDKEANLLRCLQVWRAPRFDAHEFEQVSRDRAFAPGEGLPGRVWANKQPLAINDVAGDQNFPRAAIAAREGLRAALAFPILIRGEVLGVMEFFSPAARHIDEHLLATMRTIGSQIGQFMERKRVEEEGLRLQAEVIRMQDALLQELSTPIIPVSDNVVIVPLIGTIDERRAGRILNTLLRGLESRQARIAILDITGVHTVDAHVAKILIQASQAVRLLGARVVLTGIRPEVARTLVRLGLDLRGVVTHGSLQSGIAYALGLAR